VLKCVSDTGQFYSLMGSDFFSLQHSIFIIQYIWCIWIIGFTILCCRSSNMYLTNECCLKSELRYLLKLECDGCPAEYRWRPLRKFRNSIPCTTPQSLADPAAGGPCSNAANIGESKTWMQSEFCTWRNSVRGKSPRKCIYSVLAQETAKHRVKFGWPPVNDVAAVTKPRRETSWNLLGCPKLANRSQPLVGRSSSYCGDMRRRYCFLISFFRIVDIRLSCKLLSPTKLCHGSQMAIFCVIFASCISSEPRAAHFRPAF